MSIGQPWKTRNSNFASPMGVSTRSVNSRPWMGTILRVGFSAAVVTMLKLGAKNPGVSL